MPAQILIADDDASVRSLLVTLARRAGLEVDEVADGETALQRLREREYEVLLLDLVMPLLDGMSIVNELRYNPRRPAVIVVTSFPASMTEGKLEPDLVDAIIHKPFDVELVSSVIVSLAGAMHQKVIDDTIRTRSRKQAAAAAGLCPYCSFEFSPPPAGDNAYVRTSIMLHLARCPLRPELRDDRDLQRLVDQISDSVEKHFHPDVN